MLVGEDGHTWRAGEPTRGQGPYFGAQPADALGLGPGTRSAARRVGGVAHAGPDASRRLERMPPWSITSTETECAARPRSLHSPAGRAASAIGSGDARGQIPARAASRPVTRCAARLSQRKYSPGMRVPRKPISAVAPLVPPAGA